jgi:hypothetical protein
MKKVLFAVIFLLSFSSFAQSFYVNEGNLFDPYNQYVSDGVIDFDIQSNKQGNSWGFVLKHDSKLFYLQHSMSARKSQLRYISFNVSEIGFPYFISNDSLYYFNGNQVMFLASGATNLCANTVASMDYNGEITGYYYIEGTRLRYAGMRPLKTNCR